MEAKRALINQLEDALVHRDLSHRAEALRRVVDLFEQGTGTFSGEQIELFDEVMNKLLNEIETSTRAALGQRLATFSDAPPRVLREFALDEAIAVAGPVLSTSERLDEATLAEAARSGGQEHLLAIARRRVISEPVTDALLDRGNREVVQTTAGNSGARFSSYGCSKLVDKAQQNEALTLAIWARSDIPRQHLLTIFAQASEATKLKLQAADPARASILGEMVAQAADDLQAQSREHSVTYKATRDRVLALWRAGGLNDLKLAEFARERRFEELTLAVSAMANLPISLVERAMVHRRTEQTIVLAKAINLSWGTTEQILIFQTGSKSTNFEQWKDCFARLHPAMARKAVEFYRLREQATRCA
jgi:uncharacterized protein (DUF2336 family)